VANINEAVGVYVTRLNYLGDWGTQFGYLLAGMDRFNADPLSSEAVLSIWNYLNSPELISLDLGLIDLRETRKLSNFSSF
jgi:arginyl-tRNA synthetase